MNYNDKKNILKRFYRSLNFKGFKTITDAKKEELDSIILIWYEKFHQFNLKGLDFVVLVAIKLIEDPSGYNILTGDEIAYFFIKMIDPELLALECYEVANTNEECRKLLLLNLGYCDSRLIVLEKYYNNRFQIFNKEEMWSLERIKKDN